MLVENVSLVGNQRSQFDPIIRTASWEYLGKRLRSRVQLLSEGTLRPGGAAEPAGR